MSIIIGALAIGITLGLLGSGGSILTVPMLVYVVGHDGKVAIAESLAIVGGIALFGLIPYARAHEIDWRKVLLFGLPGMVGTYAGAWVARFVPASAQLVLFAVVMLVAAMLMFRRSTLSLTAVMGQLAPPQIVELGLQGFSVGVLTGLIGVGGGFLIVPALLLLGRLSMRLAVGTSLVIIAMNCVIGLYKYQMSLDGLVIDWNTVAVFIAVGVAGTFLGRSISKLLDQQLLQRVFAMFLILMGIFVLSREIPHLHHATPQATVTISTNLPMDRSPNQEMRDKR